MESAYHPVDTGRQLNVHKMFRRRPGRLLNVLCTFNLRSVSMGHSENYITHNEDCALHNEKCAPNEYCALQNEKYTPQNEKSDLDKKKGLHINKILH